MLDFVLYLHAVIMLTVVNRKNGTIGFEKRPFSCIKKGKQAQNAKAKRQKERRRLAYPLALNGS